MRIFSSADELTAAVETHLGPGPWRLVEQERVNAFAAATDDEQWIHVDPERAAGSRFGGTIAHGYLTLSLLPSLLRELYTVRGFGMAVNYGLNRVRFPAPVRIGTRIRAQAELTSVTPVDAGVQVIIKTTIEVEGGAKPACVAETVSRLYP